MTNKPIVKLSYPNDYATILGFNNKITEEDQIENVNNFENWN